MFVSLRSQLFPAQHPHRLIPIASGLWRLESQIYANKAVEAHDYAFLVEIQAVVDQMPPLQPE
jgi:hypothetical protein